jgi:benzoate/toluate 1,2-dioxygenase subunit alpha
MALQPARFYVDDRPDEGVFRVHRDVYSDPDIFELEMKYIFERMWNFLTIESQLSKPNDYITTYIGRTPVCRFEKGAFRCRSISIACDKRPGRRGWHSRQGVSSPASMPPAARS